MIATFTDFGAAGPYLGQVRAVLQQLAPGVPVVDVFADLPPHDVRAAAYLLPAYSQYLPTGSICLCVVDPGVGGERAAIAVQADGRWYVAPDNGLVSQILRRAAHTSAFEITWRPERLSDSFHGRDLFAPVCASLATGGQAPGRSVDAAALCRPDWPEDLLQIVYIDRYGNAITGLRADRLQRHARLQVAGRHCEYRRTFSEGEPDIPFWYCNANGLVEISVAGASAASAMRLRVGQSFSVISG